MTQEQYDKTETKYFLCPECKGEGVVEINIPGNEGVPEQDVEIVCRMCDGEKKVTIDQLEEWGY